MIRIGTNIRGWNNVNDMKEHDIIYLSGLVDGVGSYEVNVSPHNNYATGFRFEPKFRMGLNESDTTILGMLDEYCEEIGVSYSIENRGTGDAIRFTIQTPCEIARFTEPFGDYLIRKYKDAEIMLNEIIPAVEDGKHTSKDGLYELMGWVDELRGDGGRGRNPKYTQEWFEEEWEGELSTK